MAVRRVGQGPSGLVYILIVFVFLFLTTLGLSILFYSQREESAKKATEAQQKLEQFATSRELVEPETVRMLGLAKENGRTLLRDLQTERENLIRLITGSGEGSIEQARQALKESGIVDKPVTEAMKPLLADLKKANDRIAQLEGQIEARKNELTTLKNQYEQAQSEGEQKITELNTRIDKYQGDYNAYQKDVDAQRADIAKRLEDSQSRAAAEIRQRDNEIKRLENELTKASLRIKELISTITKDTPKVPDASQQADGRVVSVNPDDNLVYINLGQTDHLVLGMTFEVFDADRGVQVDELGDLRGKASIEVVDMDAVTATCRIARSSYSRPVLAEDLIANIVYDKDRRYKFYVFGDFDLDGDGKATLADHDQVQNLITKWGGDVIDPRDRERRLTALLGKDVASKNILPLDTDFVIVGEEPELPQPVPPGTRDPQVIKAAIQAKQKWDAYIQLRNEANSLSVPIISQNRFLALIGYYKNKL